ncbi:response regulator [Rhizobium sp.]|uniref:response regulator n=1 Tax=Rhizobium sp. TaxID=391 RepID=UPI0028A9071B
MADDTAPHALVVDDDAVIRMDAAGIIEQAGFRPLEAYDVDSAIPVLETSADDIELLFPDVQMPGSRDRLALARECAKRWPHIKILVASGQAKPGPNDLPDDAVFIGKPFSAEVVHTRLIELLPDGQKPEPLKRRS